MRYAKNSDFLKNFRHSNSFVKQLEKRHFLDFSTGFRQFLHLKQLAQTKWIYMNWKHDV